MWHLARKTNRAAIDEVLAEAARVITGEVADRYSIEDRLPPWVIINTLAHSDMDRLQRVAGDTATHPGSWQAIVSYLAVELLTNSSDARELGRIQQYVLVPLELGLLDGTIRSPNAPADLALLVTSGISDLR